ncbi:MAG: ABC transporter permease subunit [Caldilineaceae bacterium]
MSGRRAKGLRERTVIVRHAAQYSDSPGYGDRSATRCALWRRSDHRKHLCLPGVGRLALQSINARDYPMVQASVLVISIVYVFLNLAVDLVYVYLDPRIRYDRSAS